MQLTKELHCFCNQMQSWESGLLFYFLTLMEIILAVKIQSMHHSGMTFFCCTADPDCFDCRFTVI